MWAPGTGPGLENQPEDNLEDRLVADIKHLVLRHFLTAISLQQCHRLKIQLTSTNRAHQPESFELITSHIERPKAANPGVHAELQMTL